MTQQEASSGERLFSLLPAVIRMQDERNGRALKVLFALIEAQSDMIERSIDQLYDDQFIESCSEWVIPYIGELVSTRQSVNPDGTPISRKVVAKTIAYRRRKGTLGCLEQVIRDAAGMDACLVEYYRRIARTQNIGHPVPCNTLADIRACRTMENIDRPYDRSMRTAEVRSISNGTGRYNIPNLGIYIWPLRPYTINGGTPVPLNINDGDWDRYTFDALGDRVPLWYPKDGERQDFDVSTEPESCPGPIMGWPMIRASKLRDGKVLEGIPSGLFRIVAQKGDSHEAIGSNNGSLVYLEDLDELPEDDSIGVAVDLKHGTFALRRSLYSGAIAVNYTSGHGGGIGGGSYYQNDILEKYRTVNLKDLDATDPLKNEIQEGKLEIVVESDATVLIPSMKINLNGLEALSIRADDIAWPCISADIELAAENPCNISIEGLRVLGGLKVSGSMKGLGLTIKNCTIKGPVDIGIEEGGLSKDKVDITIGSSILLKGLAVHSKGVVKINDSIIESNETNLGISSTFADSLDISRCTILGQVQVDGYLKMTDCLVTGVVTQVVGDDRRGCISYSAIPDISNAARLFKCVELHLDGSAQYFSKFISTTHGDPHYCQLNEFAGPDISLGSSTRSEMGAFCNRGLARVVLELRSYVDEYLPVNLEAGIRIADQKVIRREIR